MIRDAQHEICLATYSIDSSFVSTAILAHLRERAQAGVRVRVIVDGLRSKLSTDMERYLTEGGVELGIYHPLLSGHPTWLNHRMHSKLIIVDRNVIVVGSRNLNDAHFGLDDRNFIDYDAMLCGAICHQANNYFDSLWASSDVRPVRECIAIHRNRSCELRGTDARTPEAAAAEAISRFQYGVESTDGLHSPIPILQIEAHEMCLLHDPDAAKSERSMADTIVELINSSQHSVVIESPYPAFSDSFIEALQHAVERGVAVTLLTNSLASTDQVVVYAAYQWQKSRLLRSGVRLYEFPGPDRLHAKGMLVDNRIAMLGSYNFDARSEELNLELCVLTNNVAAVASIHDIMCNHQNMAVKIDQHQLSASPTAKISRRLQLRSAQVITPILRPAL